MTLAIIGLGKIGATIAQNLKGSDEQIILVDHKMDYAKKLADELGSNFRAEETEVAVKLADKIILAFWFAEQMKFINNNFKNLDNKIIIDPSNPIAFDSDGAVYSTLLEDISAGTILSQILPSIASYVKAFGTLQAQSLREAANSNPKSILYYFTHNSNIMLEIEKLIKESGFYPAFVEEIDNNTKNLEVGGPFINWED